MRGCCDDFLFFFLFFCSLRIPLIGQDGDDVIDYITCEVTGTGSINTQT